MVVSLLLTSLRSAAPSRTPTDNTRHATGSNSPSLSNTKINEPGLKDHQRKGGAEGGGKIQYLFKTGSRHVQIDEPQFGFFPEAQTASTEFEGFGVFYCTVCDIFNEPLLI